MDELKINAPLAEDVLVRFLREEAHQVGFTKAVLGISGGIDSAVSATLAAKAFGPKNVLGVIMPYKLSDPLSENLALALAKQLKIRSEKIEITAMADGYLDRAKKPDKIRAGNVLARCRMIVLYDLSARENALVIGTSNKSEMLLGYSTLFGDAASAINPLGDLYKTQIFQIASHLAIPEGIRKRKPTADLWVGQTSEGELGFTYAQVDRVLYYLVDRRYSPEDMRAKKFNMPFVKKVAERIRRNQYKRIPPIIAKLSNRTINLDFRYLRDWGT